MGKHLENQELKKRFYFKKEERLCSKKQFDKLFADGNSFLVYPLKVVFAEVDYAGNIPAKAAFAVSKKLFKRAVKRNYLKRRMREAYRLNKHILYSRCSNKKVAVIFIYVAKEMLDYHQIEKAMKKGIEKLSSRLSN